MKWLCVILIGKNGSFSAISPRFYPISQKRAATPWVELRLYAVQIGGLVPHYFQRVKLFQHFYSSVGGFHYVGTRSEAAHVDVIGVVEHLHKSTTSGKHLGIGSLGKHYGID